MKKNIKVDKNMEIAKQLKEFAEKLEGFKMVTSEGDHLMTEYGAMKEKARAAYQSHRIYVEKMAEKEQKIFDLEMEMQTSESPENIGKEILKLKEEVSVMGLYSPKTIDRRCHTMVVDLKNSSHFKKSLEERNTIAGQRNAIRLEFKKLSELLNKYLDESTEDHPHNIVNESLTRDIANWNRIERAKRYTEGKA